MGKDKLRRFAAYASFPNCFDFAYHLKGKWHTEVFHNDHPLVLELGCGKGEYTVEMARRFPGTNFTGIDLKSNRMWKGAGIALKEKLTNAVFLRLIIEKIPEVFGESEVSEIWITFPDPFPKPRHAKHRLTFPTFLSAYRKVLKPGGLVHFKTDDTDLFRFTTDMLPKVGITPIRTIWDVHHETPADPLLTEIKTHYEQLFMGRGRTIKYCSFSLDQLNESSIPGFIKELEDERKRTAEPV